MVEKFKWIKRYILLYNEVHIDAREDDDDEEEGVIDEVRCLQKFSRIMADFCQNRAAF